MGDVDAMAYGPRPQGIPYFVRYRMSFDNAVPTDHVKMPIRLVHLHPPHKPVDQAHIEPV
jgi:hypothetical protein